ncbi:MAG: antirestriction protein ArdC, partial [Methylobacterium sp.]|uniref:zincin-like metallopeptidase domain-containing protein n=1 Tax=Methylobacterium sp. TaxID=409 RepID=UPI0026005038
FGSRAYAAEELVAELGAAFVLATLGLAAEPHTNHAAYMAGWLPLVRDDPRALVTAASLASKAAQFLALPPSLTEADTTQGPA